MTASRADAAEQPTGDEPVTLLAHSGPEWTWLDAFAARTGRVDRARAAQDVIWASLFRLQQTRQRNESMPQVLEAISAVRPDLPDTGQATTIRIGVDAAMQSFLDAYADRCGRSDRDRFVSELFGGGMRLAADTPDAPTLVSVFPEAVEPGIAPERLQAIVETDTTETIACLESDPDLMTVTARVWRARGYVLGHIAVGKPFWDSRKWDHWYCSFADTDPQRPLEGCSHHLASVHDDDQTWERGRPLCIRASGVHLFPFDIPRAALSRRLAAEVRRHRPRRRMPWTNSSQ